MIPIQLVRCHIEATDNFHFGSAPGSAVRGALYAALGSMYDTYQQVDRESPDDNPVAWLLRLEDSSTSGGKDVPRPLSIRPPQQTRVNAVTFSLAFYGRAIETIPVVLSAIPLMGQLGLGRGRTRFTLSRVEAVDPLTGSGTLLINTDGETVGEMRPPLPADKYTLFAGLLNASRLEVTFRTPTRIIDRGRLQHTPLFRPWVQRLLERIRTLSEIYMDEPVWVPFGELLEQADTVRLIHDDTTWQEARSGSRHDGMMKPVSGFVGRAVYEGDLRELLPYLLIGQALQVGKNTMKGCGWYDMAYQWA